MRDYGYTVRYKRQGSDSWKVYLVTNTYALAEWHVRWYKREPPKGLDNVVWDVLPILTLTEYKVRWRGCPF